MLSEPLMEGMLIDTPCFHWFAGIDMIDGRVPGDTKILHIRHVLEEHQITDQVLECMNQSLSVKGMLLKEGAIFDAMIIINAPSSTLTEAKGRPWRSHEKSKGERNPELHSAAKGTSGFWNALPHRCRCSLWLGPFRGEHSSERA
jgi:IS5 family transposase